MKTKTLSKFFSNFWKSVIGLEPNQSIKTLSEEELNVFYRDLGYNVLAAVLFIALLLWITTTTVATGKFDTLIAISFGFVVGFFLIKICWQRLNLKVDFHDEIVDAKFFMDGDDGFLSYGGKDYPVEDFSLMDDKLCDLDLTLSKTENKEERIFYIECADKFIKRTESIKNCGIRKSYKIVSWAFFSVCVLSVISMVVGALIIIL